jgi:hypothetical protein
LSGTENVPARHPFIEYSFGAVVFQVVVFESRAARNTMNKMGNDYHG